MSGHLSQKEHLLGIVFVTFEDTGPQVIYNDTILTEEQTMTLAVDRKSVV